MRAPTLPALFVSHWRLDAALCVQAALVSGLYLAAAACQRGRWPVRHTAAFLAGVGCTLLALQSGLETYDDRLLSAHMAQHMLLLLAAPLLLLLGRPLTLTLRSLRGAQRRSLAGALGRTRPLTRPLPCLGAFAAIVVGTHLPAFYDLALSHPAVHDAEHILYLLAGGLFWWPLLDGDPALAHRLGGLGRLLYLLVGMLPMAIVGAYLNRHPSVVYAPYGEAAHALGVSALSDQATAGAIMWVAGNTTMAIVGLWAVMVALSAEERRQQARESYARTRVPPPGTTEGGRP